MFIYVCLTFVDELQMFWRAIILGTQNQFSVNVIATMLTSDEVLAITRFESNSLLIKESLCVWLLRRITDTDRYHFPFSVFGAIYYQKWKSLGKNAKIHS